ncbi:MAG: ine55 [Candidatus Doudnabacteria bacterium]|nr:ine55 [Candidatus Doudnabacteria bacterium]
MPDSNKEIFNIYKPLGWTPLQALRAFQQQLKKSDPGSILKPMTYAGRLDPAAEGVLLLLSGEQIKNKALILSLNKSYVAKILFGFESDTYDALGLTKTEPRPSIQAEKVQKILQSYIGDKQFTLPGYSSVPVQGKPLFKWAQENKLDQIAIPKRAFKITKAQLIKFESEDSTRVKETIFEMIEAVSGNFRQDQIKSNWSEIFTKIKQPLQIAVVEVDCGSGAYIRSIADQLGKDLDNKAILLSLVRTKIGEYSAKDSISVLPQQYADSSPNL